TLVFLKPRTVALTHHPIAKKKRYSSYFFVVVFCIKSTTHIYISTTKKLSKKKQNMPLHDHFHLYNPPRLRKGMRGISDEEGDGSPEEKHVRVL
ncbi:hypothetical protein OAV88_03610, partial [bacterium]|nr:hypothetical protein [bacterium]